MWIEIIDKNGVAHMLNVDNIDHFVRVSADESKEVKVHYTNGGTEVLYIDWGLLSEKILYVQRKSWGCF